METGRRRELFKVIIRYLILMGGVTLTVTHAFIRCNCLRKRTLYAFRALLFDSKFIFSVTFEYNIFISYNAKYFLTFKL